MLPKQEKEAKNPPLFKKLFANKSVEQEAMEAFAAKRKAQQQRDELKQWLQFTVGSKAWDELIKMEGQIRKQRQDTLYRQRERRQKFIEIVVIALSILTGAGLLFLLVYIMNNR